MTLRSILFWPHLVAGVLAGAIILIMSVTGVLLTYEKQMVAWADRREVVAPAGRAAMPLGDLLARVAANAGARPVAIVLAAAPDAPAVATIGQRVVLVDPYDGSVLGDSAPRLRRFFRAVTDWHRWLAAAGENRALGRAVTGFANLIFLFIVVSGLYLWMPRKWTLRHIRAVALFNGRLSGKARDFNWHNVIGLWSAIPLFLVVISATPISFPWANTLLFRSVGEMPPAPAAGGAPRAAAAAPVGNSVARESRSAVDTRNSIADAGDAVGTQGIDIAWQRARRQVDGWRAITFRPPASPRAPLVFTIDRGTAGQPQHRGTLTVDRQTGAVERWEPFATQSRGRRLRSVARFLHTGEVLGVAGQTVAGAASLGGAVLVWTGVALAYRRFFVRAPADAVRNRPAA